MVGGATPDADGSQLVLSLARLNRVRAIDPVDLTMTIEAGVTLKAAQTAAADADCLLPLSISSEGSAQIGGVLATNAGGNNTVRYGNARDLVLGLEGRAARRADLERVAPAAQGQHRLLPAPAFRRLGGHARRDHRRGVQAGAPPARGCRGTVCPSPLHRTPRGPCSPASRRMIRPRCRRSSSCRPPAWASCCATSRAPCYPSPQPGEHYVLVGSTCHPTRPNAGLRPILEDVLGHALADALVLDAAIAESEAQRAAIWRLREEHSEAQKREGASVKNDVSVPVSKVPEFIRRRHVRLRGVDTRHPGGGFRPHGRRKYPLQP